jgi:hypothetical protein
MWQTLFSLAKLVVVGSITKAVPFADEPFPVVLECVNGTKEPSRLLIWCFWGYELISNGRQKATVLAK